MTTMEIPTIGGYLSLRLARLATKRKERNAYRMRNVYETIVRLVMHLAGFALLTMAGFTWNMPAGLITAGISCFLMSTLMTSRGNAEAETPTRR